MCGSSVYRCHCVDKFDMDGRLGYVTWLAVQNGSAGNRSRFVLV